MNYLKMPFKPLRIRKKYSKASLKGKNPLNTPQEKTTPTTDSYPVCKTSLHSLLTDDYSYEYFQIVFPDLTKKLQDTFLKENSQGIGEIIFIKTTLEHYILYNGAKSNLKNPCFIDDVLVIKTDLHGVFDDAPKGTLEYLIKRSVLA